jgi:hypothetical protein
MYCKNCGIEISDDSKFCFKCGTKLSISSSDPIEENTQKEEINFTTELNDLRELILTNNVEIIPELLESLIDFKEKAEIIIKNYHKLFRANLIDDLKELSNSYDKIKMLLKKFIEFEIIENQYPHNKFNNKTQINAPISKVNSDQKKSQTDSVWIGIFIVIILIVVFKVCSKSEKRNESSNSQSSQTSKSEANLPNDINSIAGKIFTFKSTLNDKEENGQIIQTNHETTYHKFDFVNKTVTQTSPLNGEWITITYPISGIYEEKALLATTYVLVVGEMGVKEIWFNPVRQNLGYDYVDGSRIACYELSTVE